MSRFSGGTYSPKNEVNVLLPEINGGVVLGKQSSKLDDNAANELVNMWFKDGILKTRPGITRAFTSEITGEYHSGTKRDFFGYFFCHIGSGVYAFDGRSEPISVLGNAGDCGSFFCEMAAALYLYTRERKIFVFKKNEEGGVIFSAEEADVKVPRIITNAAPSLQSYEQDEPMNLLSRKVSVRYKHSQYKRVIKLPYPADTDIPFEAVIDEKKKLSVKSCEFSDENTIFISAGNSGTYLDITYTLSEEYTKKSVDMLFGCSFGECYGGTALEGTRLFCSGNPDYPGYYFRSELLNPLYFKDTEFDIIGNGNAPVTAFEKCGGDLYAFTTESIGRIIYSFGSEGASFSAREVSSLMGCDMPGSVALIDNRIVFANKKGGVHIIVSSEYTDEDNIVKLSANIAGKRGKSGGAGLLNESDEALASCISTDFDGKYFLFVGGRTYIWDYARTPYTSALRRGENHSAVCWYIFEGIEPRSVFNANGKLSFILKDSGCPAIFSEEAADDLGVPIKSVFLTKSYDISLPHTQKLLDRVRLGLTRSPGSKVKLEVLADGKCIHSEEICSSRFSFANFDFSSFSFSAESDNYTYRRLPKYKARSFALRLTSERTGFGAEDVELIFAKHR